MRQIEEADTSVESAIQQVLDELCVKLGFCFGPDANAALRVSPASGVNAFVEAVIRHEGMDPEHIDTNLRRQMREIVEAGAGRIL